MTNVSVNAAWPDGPAMIESPDKGPSTRLILLIAGVGILLRLALLLANRSLWLDEAMLAIAIAGKPFTEILGPLEYSQIGPLGWLTLEWSLVELLGPTEFAVRLVPFLLGVAAIPVFHRVARRLLSRTGVVIAMLLFCISEPLVYYSAEMKPYSADVLCALLALWCALRYLQDGYRISDLVGLGVVGAIGLLLSFTSVFVMGGFFAVVFLVAVKGHRKSILPIILTGGTYIALFGLYFLLFLKPNTNASLAGNMASSGRMAPMPPVSVNDVEWYIDTLFDYFVDPMGFKAIGGVLVARRSRWLVLLLVAPALMGLLASMLQKYPFTTFGAHEHPLRGRYIIFSMPMLMLLAAGGLAWLWGKLRAEFRRLSYLLLVVLLWHPLYRIAYDIKLHPDVGDIRSVMQELKAQVQPGDVVYHSWFAEAPYRFYRDRFGLKDVPTFGGTRPIVRKFIEDDAWTRIDDWVNTESLFEPYLNKGRQRIWLVFVHHPSSFGYADEKNLLNHLRDRGKQLGRFSANNATLTLFELSP